MFTEVVQPAKPIKSINEKYFKTYDWYDLDDAIETNDHLYWDMDEIERKWFAKRPQRLIIYPKDIQVIYGRSPSFARHLLQKIRKSLGKPKGHPVMIAEFCKEMDLDFWTVNDFIMES